MRGARERTFVARPTNRGKPRSTVSIERNGNRGRTENLPNESRASAECNKAGLLVGGLVRGRLQLVSRVAEVALVTDSAPIRVDGEEAVEQKLKQAFSFGPADRRASTAWANGGPN
jgi:hypothetical protein